MKDKHGQNDGLTDQEQWNLMAKQLSTDQQLITFIQSLLRCPKEYIWNKHVANMNSKGQNNLKHPEYLYSW